MVHWQKNLYLLIVIIAVAFIYDFDLQEFLESDKKNSENDKKNSESDENSSVIIDVQNFSDFYSIPVIQHNTDIQKDSKASNPKPCMETHVDKVKKPKFWCHHIENGYYQFKNVKKVLNILDMQEIPMDLTSNETTHHDWDLLWAFQFHDLFSLPFNWSAMKKHQKINHIPGNHVICSKSFFGTTTNSKYVPKAFTDLNKLREYAEKFPSKKFVTKLKSNRGVQLKNVSEMNFVDTKKNTVGEFAQEFIQNPLLWNGHKFDVGIYVIITSVNPLRLYYLTNEMVVRICSKPYNISDVNDQSSYAISDIRLDPHEFNGSEEFFNNDYTVRESFEDFLMKINADVGNVWWQIEDAIRSIIVSKEKYFIEWIDIFKTTKRNHFEMFRFDMILDDNLNIHIMEINQHPGVYASEKFIKYESEFNIALYNLFNIVGVGTKYRKENLEIPSSDIEGIIANKKHLQVRPDVCLSGVCRESCSNECKLCWNCLSQERKDDLAEAYIEQLNIGDLKRLFPPDKKFLEAAGDDFYAEIQPESKFHLEWFAEMCNKNPRFC